MFLTVCIDYFYGVIYAIILSFSISTVVIAHEIQFTWTSDNFLNLKKILDLSVSVRVEVKKNGENSSTTIKGLEKLHESILVHD